MIEERIKYLFAFISYVFQRYSQNRCSSIAAELTVTSLLALVPLTAVVLALLAFIPSFQNLGEQLQSILYQYFVPSTGETVQSYIKEFVGKARGLSGLGSVMLIVTALALMRTIDQSFNKIWHVKSTKSLVRTLLVYWAVLTLGPIFLGSSLVITSYIKSLPIISDVVGEHGQWFTLWLPFLMAGMAFSVMFYVIPNRKIFFWHAALSGLITTALFEIAKFAFGLFVSSVSTYQLIFGALAAVPLFLIWIYLSWGIVLLGAEICHALAAFELEEQSINQHPFIEVVEILLHFAEAQKNGELVDDTQLKQLGMQKNKQKLNVGWIQTLIDSQVIARTQEQTYCLISNASKLDYQMIFNLVGRQFPVLEQINQSNLPEKNKQEVIAIITSTQSQLKDHQVI
ncbi:YihY family inner membrane protein [Aliikangiella sp. IMCC44359]|uniref:YihY family inner membrane protein n=1 Tax=Aliikangiella sp. IMCC44359 TaxID=3459125 RepID=UPI00403AB17E